MTLQAGLNTSLSSLQGGAKETAIRASNIAAQTPGSKAVNLRFSTLVSGNGIVTGITTDTVQDISRQGAIEASSSKNSLAIVGQGFIPVMRFPNADELGVFQEFGFARDLRMEQTNQGYLRLPSGYFMSAWALDENGNLPASLAGTLDELEAIKIDDTEITAQATSELGISPVLAAQGTLGAVGQVQTVNTNIIDSLGNQHQVNITWTKITNIPTQFRVNIASTNPLDRFELSGNPGSTYEFFVQFDNDGIIEKIKGTRAALLNAANPTDAPPSLTAIWDATNLQSAVADNVVSLDIGENGDKTGTRSIGMTFSKNNVKNNGRTVGTYEKFETNEDGKISFYYSNGAIIPKYKLALGLFANPDGLEMKSGNLFFQSTESGNYNLKEANTNGTGAIAVGAQEGTNVDVATEFAALIVAQTHYTMNSRAIQTMLEMMNTINRLGGN